MQQIQNKQFSKFTSEFMEIPPIADQLDILQHDSNNNIYLYIDIKYQFIVKFIQVKCKQNATIKELKNIIQLQVNHMDFEKMVLEYKNIICVDECKLEDYQLQNYNTLTLSKRKLHQLNNILIYVEMVAIKSAEKVIECDQNMRMSEFWKLVVEVFKQFINENIPKYDKKYDIIECKIEGQFVSLDETRSFADLQIQNKSKIIYSLKWKGGCFPGYAPITLKDGNTKTINTIKIDDELLSYDDKINAFVINNVISIKVGKAHTFIQIQTQNIKLVCTPNHPFYTQDGWKAYKPNPDYNFQELTINDKILDQNNQYQQILSIEEQLNEGQLIYNLTTDRPNTFIAFGFVVHNMDKLNIILPNGKSVELEISQKMLIKQLKILIHQHHDIPVERQQLYFNGRLLDDYKTFLEYQNQNLSGIMNEIVVVDKNQDPQKKNEQLPYNILQFKLISNNYQYPLDISDQSTVEDLKNYIKFMEKSDQIILIYKGMFLNEELNECQISILDNNSTILVLNPQSGAQGLKFMKEIGSLLIQDVTKIQESLQFMKQDQMDKITHFIETQIKEINQDKLKVAIYQKYQLHELLAIKIYSSDIVYRDLNIDIRTNQYSKWRPFQKCLINSIRKCNYYQGVAYRGVMNYQDLDYYSKGKIIQWSQISSISKKSAVCDQFSNEKGTQFYINLISAKDISQLSIYPQEEEIVMLPYSQFEVEEVQVQQGSAVKVNLRELPLPRQANVILWVDDQPQNNHQYVYQLEQENLNVSVVFCTSTLDAIKVVKQYKWMIYLEGSNFRIVTDMVREENGKLNYLAGIDLLAYLFKEIDYKNEVMVFCGDVKIAEENCKVQKIIGSYKISNNQVELMRFIRFL